MRGAAAGLGADVYGSERQMKASAAAPALQSTLAGMASLGVSDAISGVIGEDIASEAELTVPERVVAVVPVAATPFGRILGKLPIVGRLFGKVADAPKGGLFRNGQLFETAFETSQGKVGMLAETVVNGKTLHLKEVVIEPLKTGKLNIGPGEVLAARNQLIEQARLAGFEKLIISGERLTGANKGKLVELIIDLTK